VNEQITTLLPQAEPMASGVPAPAAGVDYDWAVDQFYDALYKFAFGLAGSESDAADLTQDTYRVLLTKGDAIRDARKVKSWLFTTLYRQFLGRRRHATRFPEMPVDSAEWELPTITPQHADALDGSLVVGALQQLEEKYRAPLALFYLEELSYKEMAEVLGIPIGTIMSRMSRGKEMLRRRLQAPSPTAVSCHNTKLATRFQGRAMSCAV
jgi:RNA polymerase sigma-70 factor (ECF subfamily)